jgi:ribosomal protein L37AE/L43A
MIMFDEIPEDRQEANQCPNCQHGSVYEIDDGVFECDSCDFEAFVSNSRNNQAGYVY